MGNECFHLQIFDDYILCAGGIPEEQLDGNGTGQVLQGRIIGDADATLHVRGCSRCLHFIKGTEQQTVIVDFHYVVRVTVTFQYVGDETLEGQLIAICYRHVKTEIDTFVEFGEDIIPYLVAVVLDAFIYIAVFACCTIVPIYGATFIGQHVCAWIVHRYADTCYRRIHQLIFCNSIAGN